MVLCNQNLPETRTINIPIKKEHKNAPRYHPTASRVTRNPLNTLYKTAIATPIMEQKNGMRTRISIKSPYPARDMSHAEITQSDVAASLTSLALENVNVKSYPASAALPDAESKAHPENL